MNDDHNRPVTLYVEGIDTRPNLPAVDRQRVSHLDLEITQEVAIKLLAFLTDRIEQDHGSAIRFRLTGRLVIH